MYTQKIEVAAVGSSSYTDITNYLAPQGFEWRRIDVDLNGPTTQDGVSKVVRIREKYGAVLTFREQLDSEAYAVLGLLKDKHVQLRFYNPEYGTKKVYTMRTGNVSIKHYVQKGTGALLQGYSMELEED